MVANETIIKELKEIVQQYDPNAVVIFFGSRLRGDFHEESDWDFLVLSQLPESNKLKDKVRNHILDEIELKHNVVVSVLWHNKQNWEENYTVTNIYDSIKDEGVLV